MPSASPIRLREVLGDRARRAPDLLRDEHAEVGGPVAVRRSRAGSRSRAGPAAPGVASPAASSARRDRGLQLIPHQGPRSWRRPTAARAGSTRASSRGTRARPRRRSRAAPSAGPRGPRRATAWPRATRACSSTASAMAFTCGSLEPEQIEEVVGDALEPGQVEADDAARPSCSRRLRRRRAAVRGRGRAMRGWSGRVVMGCQSVSGGRDQ